MQFETFEPTQIQHGYAMLDANRYGGNRCAVFRLEGPLDEKRLGRSIEQVIRRCPPLSYKYLKVDGALQILVSADRQVELSVIDVGDGTQESVYGLIDNLRHRQFRLDGGAPYLFCLLRGEPVNHLVLVCHPAVIDRFSLKPLFRALSAAYRGDALPDDLGLAQEVLLQEEKARMQAAAYEESMRFWLQLIRESSFAWRPGRVESDLSETYHHAALSEESSAALGRLSGQLGIGLDHLLLFAFHIFLCRVARSETVLTAFGHRIRSGLPDQIGFNETRPIFKSLFSPGQTVGGYLRQAARLLGQARHHSNIPTHEVIQELVRQDPDFRSTNILFDGDTLPYNELSLERVCVTLLPEFSHRMEMEDIAVHFEQRDAITFHVLTRFPQDMAGLKTAFAHYLALLDHLPGELDRPVSAAELYTEPLKGRALHLASGGATPAPAVDVLTRFIKICDRMPDAPAVRFGQTQMSYRQLSRSAGAIAAHLGQIAGGRSEVLIGICLPRSERVLQAIFGILAAGFGYLPLDPQMPSERLAFIAEDANLSAVIADRETHPAIASIVKCPVHAIEDLLDRPAPIAGPCHPGDDDARRIAYVIYTSGTTGKPKGVVIERGMLAHLIASLEGVWDRGPGSRWMQFASVNFDASVLEIFNPLAHGGELVVVPGEARTDPEMLFALLRDNAITHAFLPPALLRLLPRRALPDLTAVFCGGEAGDEDTVRFWSKAAALSNIYGPTEATVMATLNLMGGAKLANNLGRPLPGYCTYLLDDDDRLTPLGGIGEICIGGPSVARGYLGRPELTAQKFGANPFGPGRMYRTGDLGRFLPNGELEFLGRSDFQVKIRGFRIELGDIESAIADQAEVKEVYVGAFDDPGGKKLMAWYVAEGLSPSALRDRLAKRLSHYMIPSALVPLRAFPLNISGKIDRARLPMPDSSAENAADRPLDELENQVRDIWAGVLNVPPAKLGNSSNFFHLGGHSLLVVLVCSRLSEALGRAIRPKQLFEHPDLADFCDDVRETPQADNPLPSLVACGCTSAPVGNRLIGMIHSRAMRLPGDNTYNIVLEIDFSDAINPLVLHRALGELLEAHPVFRAAFSERNHRLWVEAREVKLPAIPLVDSTPETIAARADALLTEPLGIAHAPLWRAEIHCIADGATRLMFCVHHAIFDGWSLNLFLEELAERYEGRPPRPRLTWFDYCNWSVCLPSSPPFGESIAYWKTKLAGAEAHTELPADFRRKQAADTNAALALRISPRTVKALKTFADEHNITLPPLLFSLYLAWTWRLSGQEELVCGYPYAGRDIPGSEDIFGMFVTMGFLRQKLQPRRPFSELALAVHRQMLDDKDHLLATPYDAEIAGLESLNLIFSLQSGIGLEGSFGGATFKAEELPSRTSKADLTGIFYQSADGAIEGRIEYDGSFFHRDTVAGFLDIFTTMVEDAARRPEAPIVELNYQPQAALNRFLDLSCGPAANLPDTSIATMFDDVARTCPDQTALVFGERRHSYRELAHWSDRIAAGLCRHLAPGGRIGLSMQKSDGLVATVLGILKLGCAYVPLDPGYPPDRVRYFAENCAVTHVAADAESRAMLCAMGLSHLTYIDPPGEADEAAAPLPRVAPEALAYIIHTSGSTGKPKGVMIEQRSVVRFALAAAAGLDLTEGSVGALIASMNFDASVLEIFPSLLTGRTLVVIPEEARKDPTALHRAIDEHNVTHVVLSPVVLQNLPREPLPSVRMLGFGGDVIDEQTADWWSRRTRLFSLYGPTETTVMASLGQVLPGANPRIIGKPMSGYRIYLLNRYKQPVPQGVVGELCIGGEGLARGYLNRDDLTIERFVLDPFGGSPYALMYLTGDLGRFLSDGTIEFIGRNDAQIKLRGFRIELGEIENSLGTFPGMRQVACAAKGQGDNRYLAAYYTAGGDLDEEALRRHAAAFLPDYMIPSFFVRLASLPASPSGKIDRGALPEISGKECLNPPREGLERRIADIWEEILRYRGIARDENFFRVGGNSLLAVRMQAEIRKQLGLEFSIAEFYGAPTIEALASGHRVNHIQMAVQDARRGLAVVDPAPQISQWPVPRTVLLTGAGGFLGGFLLEALTNRVDTVFCLLRCSDPEDGLAILAKQARAAGLSPRLDRVRVMPGDLAAPGLGLTGEARRQLARDADAILHCGAFVHHLHSYPEMKAANVDSTAALLELALAQRRKPFCFISTITVGTSIQGAASAAEQVLAEPPAIDNGYVLTKWVGEQLVAQCAARYGLPALIARPGNITGSSRTGYSNYANNHFWLFAKGCLQLGAYPDMPSPVEMTPVDSLARAIVALVLSPKSGLMVANLSNPATLSQREFFQLLADSGCPAQAESPAQWQRRLADVPPENGLAAIKTFYTDDLTGAAAPIEQAATRAALTALGAAFPRDYASLVRTYVAYLKQEGFLA